MTLVLQLFPCAQIQKTSCSGGRKSGREAAWKKVSLQGQGHHQGAPQESQLHIKYMARDIVGIMANKNILPPLQFASGRYKKIPRHNLSHKMNLTQGVWQSMYLCVCVRVCMYISIHLFKVMHSKIGVLTKMLQVHGVPKSWTWLNNNQNTAGVTDLGSNSGSGP